MPIPNVDRPEPYELSYKLDPVRKLPPIISMDETDEIVVKYVVRTTDYSLYTDKNYAVGMLVAVKGLEEVVFVLSTPWDLETMYEDELH